jgi:putative ABC transport system permease protein
VQWGEYLWLPGVPDPILVRLKLVDPGYFGALGIPLVSGRGVEARDRASAPPIVVINQEVARQLSKTFGISKPVGRRVSIEVPGYGPIPESPVNTEIVGVIRSERTSGLNAPPDLVAYLPLAQAPRQDINLVVRTRTEPPAAMPGIREAVRQIDPNLPLGDVMTMEQVKQESTLWMKQPTWVLGAFAAVAALLAALGLYGVLAHAVTQQRREIGIRMAIGASSGDVLSHILGSALSMLIVGLVVGLTGAFALTRVLKSLLFQVSALDPAALAAAGVLMTIIGILAAWIPATRAAHVSPMTVLRDEG